VVRQAGRGCLDDPRSWSFGDLLFFFFIRKMQLHQVGDCEIFFGVFAVAVRFLDNLAELR
jgi:hypothetical protein